MSDPKPPTPERVKIMREVWQRVRTEAMRNFTCYVEPRPYWEAMSRTPMAGKWPDLDPLEPVPTTSTMERFAFGYETSDAPPWRWRVMCEGVELESGPADQDGRPA